MSNGFYITKLSLSGKDISAAEVLFTKGLNVIAGPSDTGKTFIYQCIDYMLGAAQIRDDIPEAKQYDRLHIWLRSFSNETEYVLERSLRGGAFSLSGPGIETRILAEKHSADNADSASQFLLSLSGFEGKKVRTNQSGETRTLSFRDLAKLILIDEETVISKKSPILSGQYVTGTVEKAVFRLLLTGIDDSSVIAARGIKIAKGQKEGQSEVLNVLAENIQRQIADLKLEADAISLQEQIDRIDIFLNKKIEEITIDQESVTALEEERRKVWIRQREVESRIDVLSELQERFNLLQGQYHSDLRRLESIADASARLSQIPEESCPICGAPSKYHKNGHKGNDASLENVANACKAEASKIESLLGDLANTLAENSGEIGVLREEYKKNQDILNNVSDDMQARLQPRIKNAMTEFRDVQSKRDACRNGIELYHRLYEIDALREKLSMREIPKPDKNVQRDIGSDEAEEFSREVEKVLQAWHFPSLGRVTFSENDQDVVITGQRRASHGKGVRAITHAAFNIALLKYCLNKSMPHPKMVMVDSPLVVYREPDQDETGFIHDVKNEFYRSLSTLGDCQIIILENENPPPDIKSTANVIRFTGVNQDRKGFIPENGTSDQASIDGSSIDR